MSGRKFFGRPSSTKAPTKQSKLSFSSKPSAKDEPPSSSSTKQNEDIEMHDEGGSDTEIKPKAEKEEDVDMKENVKPGKGMLNSHSGYTSLRLILILILLE